MKLNKRKAYDLYFKICLNHNSPQICSRHSNYSSTITILKNKSGWSFSMAKHDLHPIHEIIHKFNNVVIGTNEKMEFFDKNTPHNRFFIKFSTWTCVSYIFMINLELFPIVLKLVPWWTLKQNTRFLKHEQLRKQTHQHDNIKANKITWHIMSSRFTSNSNKHK